MICFLALNLAGCEDRFEDSPSGTQKPGNTENLEQVTRRSPVVAETWRSLAVGTKEDPETARSREMVTARSQGMVTARSRDLGTRGINRS